MNTSTALILTNSQDATADYLCGVFRDAGLVFRRFNTDCDVVHSEILYRDNEVVLNHHGIKLRPEEVSTVWFRRPKPLQLVNALSEASNKHASLEWSEALEGMLAHIPKNRWINHPSNNSLASHKIEQITTARKMGLLVPDSIVTNNPAEASRFIGDFSAPVIVKPLASGYVESDEGDFSIYTQRFQECHLPALDYIQDCPVLFQRLVDKVVDVRVTVLDEYMIAVSLAANDKGGVQRLDIRRDNMSDVHYEIISIPRSIQHAIREIIANYDLRFAAIDFAINQVGQWVFFEINPNGQWAWLDLCAEAKISDAFVEVFLRDQISKSKWNV